MKKPLSPEISRYQEQLTQQAEKGTQKKLAHELSIIIDSMRKTGKTELTSKLADGRTVAIAANNNKMQLILENQGKNEKWEMGADGKLTKLGKSSTSFTQLRAILREAKKPFVDFVRAERKKEQQSA